MARHDSAVRSKPGTKDDKSLLLRWINRSWIPGLLCAGVIFGLSSRAEAEPVENRIYSDCTFTIADLQDLDIVDLESLNGGQLQASYIIIYVRENPNDGQEIWEEGGEGPEPTGTFTGPILCTNADTDVAVPTTEDTLIPDSGTVDILGAEEASHLQYEPTGGDPEKRVCHTVAGNTDCFLIQPSASPPPLE